jgi:1-deoxy-D-xylulose-5-phosphate reductoisomerase
MVIKEAAMKKRISVLGSTGSIGTQTLDVIRHHPDRFEAVALAASGSRIDLLVEQALEFRPKWVAVAREELAGELERRLPDGIRVAAGETGLAQAAAEAGADIVVSAIVGTAGLVPTLAAVGAGIPVALANKESLVAAGHLVMAEAAAKGVPIIPVDSEHSAIFQCLNGEPREAIDKLILTASGGAFRNRSREELTDVTPDEALRHPNWAMGAKVTIDSATLANKGLEVMEAHWLFGVPFDDIDVLLHDESVIHSMVQFADGSVMAQLGTPDMRIPIQYALTWPDRLDNPARRLDLAEIGRLHFRRADVARFPMLRLAYEAGRTGGTLPAVFNAANETAVQLFLQRKIRFLQIEEIVERVMEAHRTEQNPDLGAVLEADRQAREAALSLVSG